MIRAEGMKRGEGGDGREVIERADEKQGEVRRGDERREGEKTDEK